MRTAAILAAVAFAAALPADAQTVPAGFADEPVASGFTFPVGMAFLPDSRFLVIEAFSGNVKLVTPSATALLLTIPNLSFGNERGLLGVAVDPEWPVWPYVYFNYAHNAPQSVRIVRYTASGNLNDPSSTGSSLRSPYFIVTNVPDQDSHHNGGTLAFGPDGMLHASFGEDNSPCSAQSTESLLGVILRVNVAAVHGATGSGPPPASQIAAPGNPYSGPNSQLVYANGLRNPFRFDIDPVTGNLYIADVGDFMFEELNECVSPGLNFGWPIFEGPAPYGVTCPGATGPYVAPIASYPNGKGSVAIISIGGRYRNQPAGAWNFGPTYEGDVFFADYYQGFIRRLKFDGTNWAQAAPEPGQPSSNNWAEGYAFVTDAEIGPDGALYYVKQAPGSVRRIRPSGTTTTPVLTIIGGDGQKGNAGAALLTPLSVQLTTGPGGPPIAGAPVTFAVVDGAGTLGPQPVLTDGNGVAATSFIPGTTSSTDPMITAFAPMANAVTFNVTWRGLIVDYNASHNDGTITFKHSETDSPLTLAGDMPPPAPYIISPFGSVWTSITNPLPTLSVLDGLGLLGLPNPLMVAGSTAPVWSQSFANLPENGTSVVLQAYAIDFSVLPSLEAVVITNAVTVTFN
jgi:glucose/arabinose dehydrogenase